MQKPIQTIPFFGQLHLLRAVVIFILVSCCVFQSVVHI